MAYDLLLRGVCDHWIHREFQQVEREILADVNLTSMSIEDIEALPRGEYNTVRLERPLGSTNIQVYLHGEYLVPPGHSEAGWYLAPDELSADPYKKTKIVFRKPRNGGGETKRIDPLAPGAFIPHDIPENDGGLIDTEMGIATGDWVEVSYFTDFVNCRKCHGIKELNDYQFSDVRTTLTIRNENKLIQDVSKAILTVIGSNPFHTYYGTSVTSSLGEKQSLYGITQALVTKEIIDMLTKLQELQLRQSEHQAITERETLLELVDVTIEASPADSTVWFIDITIRNAAGDVQVVETSVIVQGTLLYEDRRGLLGDETRNLLTS